jgi:hypothetical protein
MYVCNMYHNNRHNYTPYTQIYTLTTPIHLYAYTPIHLYTYRAAQVSKANALGASELDKSRLFIQLLWTKSGF